MYGSPGTINPGQLVLRCSLLLWAILAVSCSPVAEPPQTVVESFIGGSYERRAWQIDPRKLPEASFVVQDGGLAIRVPAAATGGNAAEFKSRFKMAGNFDISAEYSIVSLPKPPKGYSNVEISLYGPSRSASFMRSEQATLGPGFAAWHEPPEEGAKGFWKFVKLDADPEDRSELVVRRRGSKIAFLARTSPDDEHREIAALDYPGTVDSLQFRLIGKRVSEPLEVRLHSIRVAADNIWYGGSSPVVTSSGGLARVLPAAIAVLLGAGATALLWRYFQQA